MYLSVRLLRYLLAFHALDKSGSRAFQQANARLKCVYFPVSKVCHMLGWLAIHLSCIFDIMKSFLLQGKENIERILENLVDKGCQISENFETFSCVSIHRLGRLLPAARWVRC